MVVPKSFSGASAHARHDASVKSSNEPDNVQPSPSEESKAETWYDYFFGTTSGDDARQQQHPYDQHQHHEGRDEDICGDDDAESHHSTSATFMSEQSRDRKPEVKSPQQSDAAPFHSWLSWLDPISGRPCLQTTRGNGSLSPQMYTDDVGSQSLVQSKSESPRLYGRGSPRKEGGTSIPSEQKSKPRGDADSPDNISRRRLVDPPADVASDDESIESSKDESKLFQDLESVPSVKTGTVAGSVELIGDGSVASISNTIVEQQLQNLNMPRSDDVTNAPKGDSKVDSAMMSIEARKQILVKELRSTIAAHGRYDVKTANISAALGDLLNESNQSEQAIRLHRDAVEIYSSKLGDDHTITMEAKLQLGKVLESAGKFEEAINIYFLVTIMRRAIKGEKDPSAADSLVLMAHALRKKDDYLQAIKELKKALKIYREALGDSHYKVSTTVDEIASLYVTIGDFEKSAAILEEVVKLKAVTQGMQSRAVAATLCTLATTYECSEDFTMAMKSLKKAYKIYTEMDGYSSKEATNTLNRIAQLYEATGDNDRASIAYLGVLRGRKINHGDDHLLVAETYYKLGHTLRESGQYEKALKCLKEGLPIFVHKAIEVNDVEMIAEVMHEMALINKDQKKFLEAARIFKQELSVRRKIGQAEYPMIARALNHSGVTEYEMKNNNKSLKYLIEALTIFKDKADGSVECAEVLFNTGLVFESSRNRERAMEAYEEAARIFREHGYKDNHPHLAKAMRKIEKLRSQKSGYLYKP